MKSCILFEKLEMLYHRLRTKTKASSTKDAKPKTETPHEKPKLKPEKPHSIAYQIIGERTRYFIPLFKDLDLNLQKSGVKINFKAYVSLTVLATILVSVAASALVPCMLFFFLRTPLLSALLFGVGAGLFSSAFSTIGFYAYPIYRADKLKRDLEDELPFTTGYMAILTSAGLSPERIFHSLSNLTVPLAISAEAKDVVRDVNLFGLDIISALEEASKRTPSERFREMLEGHEYVAF